MCFVVDVVLAGTRVEYTCMLVVQHEEAAGGEEQAACLRVDHVLESRTLNEEEVWQCLSAYHVLKLEGTTLDGRKVALLTAVEG